MRARFGIVALIFQTECTTKGGHVATGTSLITQWLILLVPQALSDPAEHVTH